MKIEAKGILNHEVELQQEDLEERPPMEEDVLPLCWGRRQGRVLSFASTPPRA